MEKVTENCNCNCISFSATLCIFFDQHVAVGSFKKIGTMLPIPDTGMIKVTTHNIGISGKTSFIQCCDMISLLQIAIKSKNIVLKTKSWCVNMLIYT